MKNKNIHTCSVCGYVGDGFKTAKVINVGLASVWGLDDDLVRKFDARESNACPACGNSARTRGLAQAIQKISPLGEGKDLNSWVIEANNLGFKVAEINSCGKLHPTLSQIKNLKYSEYVDSKNWYQRLKNLLKGISYQNIENLNYRDSNFDLVLHSEVIEHVNSPEKALKECLRVLKIGGVCLFTVPLIMNRSTKRKAKNIGQKTKSLGEPSFHGSGESDNLVFWEFGGDVIAKWHATVVLEDPEKELFVLAIFK